MLLPKMSENSELISLFDKIIIFQFLFLKFIIYLCDSQLLCRETNHDKKSVDK